MFPRAIKAITDAWVALEDEEDEEGEDELFAEEEEDEETDIESDGDAVEEVYSSPIQSRKFMSYSSQRKKTLQTHVWSRPTLDWEFNVRINNA